MPIPGGDPNQPESSSSSGGGSKQPQQQPNPQGKEEDPQQGKEPQPNPGADPAKDVYSAQYRHRLLEMLKEASGLSRPWGDLPPKVRDELSGGSQEEFVPGYEGLTIEYYKRVQEEAQKEAKRK